MIVFMDIKMIQSRIHIQENLLDLAILHSDMHRAHLILDMLSDNVFHKIGFHDASSAHRVYVQKSTDSENTINGDCLYLSSNSIDCIQQLISQCYLNPRNAKWLHYDIEARTPNDDNATLYVHLTSSSD